MTDRFLKTAAMTAAAVAMLWGCEARVDAPPANESNTAAASTGPANEAPLVQAAADPDLEWGACPPVFPAGCELAVLHGDPAEPNADVFLRVPGGYAIPPHSHSSAERMILVSGTLQVQYQGHPETTLQTGSYAFGPAKLPHQASCAAGPACILFIAFEGPVDVEPFEGAI